MKEPITICGDCGKIPCTCMVKIKPKESPQKDVVDLLVRLAIAIARSMK